MSKTKISVCKKCGNMVVTIKDGAGQLVCCGEPMQELVPNTTDAAQEKHVPVIERDGSKVVVKVGSVAHPMQDAHFIEWVYLITNQGGQRKSLKPGEEPTAEFALAAGEEPVAALEYCNLHGLWKADA